MATQINIDFEKAFRAAASLEKAAGFLDEAAKRNGAQAADQLNAAWKGANARVMLAKTENASDQTRRDAVQMREVANRIRYIAMKMRAAEEEATAIAGRNA